MAMLSLVCPNCLNPVRVPEEHLGKRVQCRLCQQKFVLESRGASAVPVSGAAPGGEVLSLDDDPGAPSGFSGVSASSEPPPLPPREKSSTLRVGAILVSLLSLAGICGSLAGIAYFLRAATASSEEAAYGRHACIAIESGGVRLIAVDLDKQGESYEWQFLARENDDIDIGRLTPSRQFDPQALKKVGESVQKFVASCKSNGVDDEDILVVCNSGIVKGFGDPTSREAAKEKLAQAIRDACGLNLIHITSEEEARFGALGCVPRSERRSALHIDVGSSNSKIGYYTSDMKFESVEFLGARTFGEKVKGYRQSHPLSFGDAAKAIRAIELDEPYQAKSKDQSALVSRPNFHLIGGGAWVVANVMHPIDQAREPRVKITEDDIDRFNELVTAKDQDKNGVIKDALFRVPASAEFEDVRRRVREMEKKFITLEYLISAGQILKSYSTVCTFSSKKVQFYTYGLHGWPLGCILVRNSFEN